MNISFIKLGEEECDACEVHKHHECTMKEREKGEKEGRHQKDSSEGEQLGERNDQTRKDGNEHQKNTDSENGCSVREAHQLHLVRANQSRMLYRADVALNNDPTKPIFSMDVQNVLMLPHLPGLKSALFTRRIILINQGIVPVGKFSVNQNFGDGGQGREDTYGMRLSKGERMKMRQVQF